VLQLCVYRSIDGLGVLLCAIRSLVGLLSSDHCSRHDFVGNDGTVFGCIYGALGAVLCCQQSAHQYVTGKAVQIAGKADRKGIDGHCGLQTVTGLMVMRTSCSPSEVRQEWMYFAISSAAVCVVMTVRTYTGSLERRHTPVPEIKV
jgi:hypothetical protein